MRSKAAASVTVTQVTDQLPQGVHGRIQTENKVPDRPVKVGPVALGLAGGPVGGAEILAGQVKVEGDRGRILQAGH
jgi:hypothetical protein